MLIGFGNASNQLSRYVAADLYPPSRRASALSTVVWGATVGAVIGPISRPPPRPSPCRSGLPDLAGAYLVPVVFVGAAAILTIVMLRPDPYALADETSRRDQVAERDTATSLRLGVAPTERPGRDRRRCSRSRS